MSPLVVVSGGYGDVVGLRAVNITVMFVVRYLCNIHKNTFVYSKMYSNKV